MDLASLVEFANKSIKEGKGVLKPRYTNAESKGKSLPLYYESGPRKQISLVVSRYTNAAAATAAYKKDLARSLKPPSSETLDYRVVKDGQHKDAAR